MSVPRYAFKRRLIWVAENRVPLLVVKPISSKSLFPIAVNKPLGRVNWLRPCFTVAFSHLTRCGGGLDHWGGARAPYHTARSGLRRGRQALEIEPRLDPWPFKKPDRRDLKAEALVRLANACRNAARRV